MKKYDKPLNYGASPVIMNNAKSLRQKMTSAEELLWINLRNRRQGNIKFRRQHPVDQFIVDFYCHEAKLAIEVDGEYHNSIEQQKADENRTYKLNRLGIKIISFTNNEVLSNICNVLEKINIECEKRIINLR